MPSKRAPNVLLFITDQQRWDTLGFTGRSPCRTPHLDRLARAGISFDRCLTPDPICSPARAALFTGRYPHATGVMHNQMLPLERPALPEVFRDAGYDVAYSGKWHLGKGRGAAGLTRFTGERGGAYREWLARHNVEDTYPYGQPEFRYVPPDVEGGDEQAGRASRGISNPNTAAQTGLSEHTFDAWVANRALEHLETWAGGAAGANGSGSEAPSESVGDTGDATSRKPFFHVCSFHGPHPVFVIPEPYYSMYDPAQAAEPANFADPMDGKPAFQQRSIWHQAARSHGTAWEPWRKSMAVYWGYVTWLDELVGRVLGRLESLGLAEDTIVIFTTDHGEMMGSHGLFQKSCMYEESLRVPFLVRAPRLLPADSGGRRIDAPVSHVDLAPTLLSLCGLSAPGRALLEPQGRDLSAWLTGVAAVPPDQRGASDDPAAGAVFCEYTPHSAGEQMTEIRCVAGPRYKYAWNRADREELYDTWSDPGELRNLATDPDHATTRSRLRERLLAWMTETDDPLLAEASAASTSQRSNGQEHGNAE